jgi:hypothetical protein
VVNDPDLLEYRTATAQLMPVPPMTAPPGEPTPDGRGLAIGVPLDVRNATVLVDGRAPEAATVRRMVVGQGGQLADRLEINTDYVVAAAPPAVPVDDAVRADAKALHVPVMTPERFSRMAATTAPAR